MHKISFSVNPEDEYLLTKCYQAGEFKNFSAFMRTVIRHYFEDCSAAGMDMSYPEDVIILDDRAWRAKF